MIGMFRWDLFRLGAHSRRGSLARGGLIEGQGQGKVASVESGMRQVPPAHSSQPCVGIFSVLLSFFFSSKTKPLIFLYARGGDETRTSFQEFEWEDGGRGGGWGYFFTQTWFGGFFKLLPARPCG